MAVKLTLTLTASSLVLTVTSPRGGGGWAVHPASSSIRNLSGSARASAAGRPAAADVAALFAAPSGTAGSLPGLAWRRASAAANGAAGNGATGNGAVAGRAVGARPIRQGIRPSAGTSSRPRPATAAVSAARATLTLDRSAYWLGHLSGARRIAWGLMPRFGWKRWQFKYLDRLWEQESGWNPRASNPYSGAYGIPQAVPGAKMASAGPDWRTSARTQIIWGMRYIRGRYRTPYWAWRQEVACGWY